MARTNQKAESLERYPHRCSCGRVAKFYVGPKRTLVCTLHVANACRDALVGGNEGTVVEVTAVPGQL